MTLRETMLADLELFFTDWAEPVTIHGAAAAGVYDEALDTLVYHDGVEYSAPAPALTLRAADADTLRPAVGQAVVAASGRFAISEVRPDGDLVTLVLRRTA